VAGCAIKSRCFPTEKPIRWQILRGIDAQDMSNQASQSLTVTLSEPLPRYSRLSLCYLPVPVRASFQYQTMPTTIMSKVR